MSRFGKFVVIGFTLAGLGAATAPAFAEKSDCGPMSSHGKWGDEDKRAEYAQKHHAMLHDKLKLTAEQEPAWKAFTEKMKPAASQSKPDWTEISKLPAPERMERMLARMKERQSRMEERVAAVKQFYSTLTPEQQKVFNEQFMHGSHRSKRR